MDYSGESLLQFLTYAADKGLMNKETARTKKVSVSAILNILDDRERQDIRQLDIDEIIHRFANLEGQKFTPSSLSVYKSRFNSSIRDFLRYKDNPLTYSATKSKPKKLKFKKRINVIEGSVKSVPAKVSNPTAKLGPSSSFGSEVLPIPIRENLTVRIAGLPFDLTDAEAQKISNVILAMAI